MTERPGAYLRTMREAHGLTVDEVVRLLGMLGLRQSHGPWRVPELAKRIDAIERDRVRPTADQLLALTIVFPFDRARYAALAAAFDVAGSGL